MQDQQQLRVLQACRKPQWFWETAAAGRSQGDQPLSPGEVHEQHLGAATLCVASPGAREEVPPSFLVCVLTKISQNVMLGPESPQEIARQ